MDLDDTVPIAATTSSPPPERWSVLVQIRTFAWIDCPPGMDKEAAKRHARDVVFDNPQDHARWDHFFESDLDIGDVQPASADAS